MTLQADVEHRLYVEGADGALEDWGLFDTFGGSGRTFGNVKRRHGGKNQETVHRGKSRLQQTTLGRDFKASRDHGYLRRLQTHSGPSLAARHVETVLDDAGNPFGVPTTEVGFIATFTPGDTDANADELRNWTIVIDVERSE